MDYCDTIYRPPSEADSLIVRVTTGCSHNGCRFCSMYKRTKYRRRDESAVLEDLRLGQSWYGPEARVFLADGDALSAGPELMLAALEGVRRYYPACPRVSAYATPSDLAEASPADLAAYRERGLSLIYLGLESGSDGVLRLMNKGSDSACAIAGCRKAKEAGISLSLMLISGLGGRELTEEHARESARVLNAIRPDYLGLLALLVEPGTPLERDVESGAFTLLSPREVLSETRLLLEGLELSGTVFRCNHASNYLALGGRLPDDKARLIATIGGALESPGSLRPEGWRGL